MFDTIFGLPLHALIVHAVVVLLPLASVAVLASAVWPKFRAWAGPLPLILSVVVTAMVPVTTESGEYLEHAINAQNNPLVQKHSQLADLLIYWSIGLVIGAAAVYAVHFISKRKNAKPLGRPVVLAAAALAVVLSVGALVHVIRVGDAGARAVWEGVGQTATK